MSELQILALVFREDSLYSIFDGFMGKAGYEYYAEELP